ARILEGRVAIIVNGSPVALTVPYLFIENFQSGDDYYINYISATVGRFLRIISFILSISIPAIYVALVTVHKEMMPTNLALSIISARSSVPFPVIVEALGLILVFEIIRETALRMPSNVSQAFSIVGAIVIGDAAVKAKFVSVPIVIIVSLSALTGLMIPRLRSAVVFYRIGLVLLTGYLGLYGYLFGVIFMTVQLLNTQSFGVNYTEFVTVPNMKNQNDIYLRLPWNFMTKRPESLSENKHRQKGKSEQ
ncbi:MAG: spore germination protein, partial [Clostridia bacterium]|nr:spore germination protein [Clostridia bacterium]